MKDKKTIGIIGMGNMGQAFMNVLSTSYTIFVWNRTPKEYQIENSSYIHICDELDELFSNCDLIITLVDKYSSLINILDNANCLKDKSIFNCTTLSPNETNELLKHIENKSGSLLNAVISNFPRQIGTSEAKVRCSGSNQVREEYINVLKMLSPQCEYLGTNPAIVNVIDTLTVGLYSTIIVSYLETQQLAEKYNISHADLQYRIQNLWPSIQNQIEIYNQEILSQSFTDSEAKISAFHTASKAFISTYENVGLTPTMLSAMSHVLDTAVSQNKQNLSISATFR
ncbi:NAD(P)-binding domain-containing protein [Acinetobacter radioresistens]|uniref:NAD(P)-binding domain-containing protein n=1 Tax=Acinetobacter radioresistens TaxID=40216 RepID=UPI0009464E4C|nr:NAD(P)-binding domain-containing protein [Acinetobacter radioresistens]